MSLLTYPELMTLVESGAIENVDPSQVNGASIDVVLGDTFWTEAVPDAEFATVDLAARETPAMEGSDGPLDLAPKAFCLAQTREVFNLPDGVSAQLMPGNHSVAAHYMLKSSLARAGLQHLFAGWADPGWNGSVLTLEFVNVLSHHALRLTPGMKAGQMVFWRGSSPIPTHASYATRGQYNGNLHAQPSKGVR